MAIVFKLMRGATTLDLQAAEGAGLRFVSWYPQSANPACGTREEPVVESVDLIATRSSDDYLAASLQGLDDMRVWADRYMRDPTTEDPVWLHAKMSAETGERRALVRSIEVEWLSDPLSATAFAPDHKAKLRLKIERQPWWEATVDRIGPTGSETAGAAFAFDYTGGASPHDVVGDVRARVPYLAIYSDATGAPLGRLWMGYRSEAKHAGLGNFKPIWECEVDGATLGTDAIREVFGTASNTTTESPTDYTAVTITPGTATWARRLSIPLSAIAADERANFGDFQWMLRFKLSAAGTWEVQLRFGYEGMDDDDFVRGPIVEVTNDAWDYAEMGRQKIPVRDLQAVTLDYLDETFDAEVEVQIWARRTSGSSSVHFDCLCPVPVDEGWLKSWNFSIGAAESRCWMYGEGPTGRRTALVYDTVSDLFRYIAAFSGDTFGPPLGDGRLIVVYAGPTSHSISTGIYVWTNYYFERWANLRGAE